MASNLGNSAGWTGSPGGFMGDASLVSWQGGPLLGVGQSADFWFTTAPTGIALTSGFVANAGLTQTPGGLLAFPINTAPAPQTMSLVVRTEVDADTSTSLTLREAITKINNGEDVTKIQFAQPLTGQTITLNKQFKIEKTMTIDGETRNVTITRDAMKGNFRLFQVGDTELPQYPVVTISNLTLKGGSVVDDGGAILSYAKLTLTGCAIRDNSATFNGGAIDAEEGTLDITTTATSSTTRPGRVAGSASPSTSRRPSPAAPFTTTKPPERPPRPAAASSSSAKRTSPSTCSVSRSTRTRPGSGVAASTSSTTKLRMARRG